MWVIGKFPFAALGRAQTYGNTDGLVKIVADKKYGEVLGCTSSARVPAT